MKKKVNKITLILGLEGQGLVNYNGNRIPKRFLHEMISNGKKNDNGSFAKEHIYTEEIIDADGKKKTIEIPKKFISSNLIRKKITGDENSVNADKLMTNKKLRVAFLSQDNVMVRGFAALKNVNLKRAGAICVTNAEQTSNTKTYLETQTTEGERDSNSLFFKETCGQIEYESEIFFDIKQLHFISIDDNYDRMSLLETDVEDFVSNINKRYGEGSAVFGNWGTTHLNVMGEQGIWLSSKVVSNIIRETIKRVFEIDIKRAGSYARTKSIKIALGYEGDEIDLLVEPKYISINNISDYDKLIEGLEIGVDYVEIEAPVIEKIEKKPKSEQ